MWNWKMNPTLFTGEHLFLKSVTSKIFIQYSIHETSFIVDAKIWSRNLIKHKVMVTLNQMINQINLLFLMFLSKLFY
jgi:hypothetical protein